MSGFQEDMIFKNVTDEDAKILLDIIGKKSKKVKIMILLITLIAGNSPQKIAKDAKIPLSRVKAIEKKN